MSRRAAIFAANLLAWLLVPAHANEPGWTEAERAQRSTAVFRGEVVSIGRVERLNDLEDLYRAVIAIGTVTKGAEDLGKDKIAVYFERPQDGAAVGRCPTYVVLKEGQDATFYVRLRKIGVDWRAFLEMGSDVIEARSPFAELQFSSSNDPKAIAAAAEEGSAAAARDIKAGKLRVLYYGKPWSNGKPLVDDATGYPVEIVAGCSVSSAFVTAVEAYNRAIREEHARAGRVAAPEKN
jgi:hypothetical protein